MFLKKIKVIYGNETYLKTKNLIKINQEIRENNYIKDFLLDAKIITNIQIFFTEKIVQIYTENSIWS